MFGTARITIGYRPKVCHPGGLTAEIMNDLLHITLIPYDSVLMVMTWVSARPKHFWNNPKQTAEMTPK